MAVSKLVALCAPLLASASRRLTSCSAESSRRNERLATRYAIRPGCGVAGMKLSGDPRPIAMTVRCSTRRAQTARARWRARAFLPYPVAVRRCRGVRIPSTGSFRF